jgi:hypothetical protein
VAESSDETAYYCESGVVVTPEGSTRQEYQINEDDLGTAKEKTESLQIAAAKHTD